MRLQKFMSKMNNYQHNKRSSQPRSTMSSLIDTNKPNFRVSATNMAPTCEAQGEGG